MLVEQKVIYDILWVIAKVSCIVVSSQARGDLPQNSCSLPCTESWQLRVGLLTSLDQGYAFTWDLRCISKYQFVQAKELPGWKIKNPSWLGDIGGKLWFGVPKMPNKIIGCQPLFFFVASCPATFARRSLTMRIVVSDLSDMRCWCMCDLWLRTASESLKLVGAFLSLVTLPRISTPNADPATGQKEHQQDWFLIFFITKNAAYV